MKSGSCAGLIFRAKSTGSMDVQGNRAKKLGLATFRV
jgi:hypothetical protein